MIICAVIFGSDFKNVSDDLELKYSLMEIKYNEYSLYSNYYYLIKKRI